MKPIGSLVWFLVCAAVPLAISVPHLSDELWYDEVVTVGAFASRPVAEIVTSYPYPNNHVLFSVLLRPFFLFAEEPLILRSLPLLCTAGTLAMIFAAGFRWGGLPVAVCATAALGYNQVFLNYCMQLRGYTLSLFLTAGLLWIMTGRRRPRSLGRHVGIILFAAGLIYTLPTNVIFVIAGGLAEAISSYSGGRRWPDAVRAGFPWLVACIVGTACYLPIMEQLMAVQHRSAFSAELLGRSVAGFLTSALHDQWWLAALAIVMFFLRAEPADGRRNVLLRTLAWMLLLPVIACVVLKIAPFARNFLPLLPPMLLIGGFFLSRFCEMVIRRVRPAVDAADHVVALLGLVVISSTALPALIGFDQRNHQRLLAGMPETPYFPATRSEFHPSKVVASVRALAAKRVHYLCLFTDQDQAFLGYYLQRADIPFMWLPSGQLPDAPVELFVISSGPPDYEQLAVKSGLDVEWLQQLPLTEDTGYFQIYRPKEPITRSEITGSLIQANRP